MDVGTVTDFVSSNTSGIRILVVDDDELNRRMMKVLLARRGYQVDLASNGLEALDAVKYKRYNLVLMDLQMPVMDGVEASRRIREWEKDTTHTFIVALTASYLPQEGQILFEAGIDNYIAKPFDFEQVQRMLRYAATEPADVVIAKELPISDPGSLTEVLVTEPKAGNENDPKKP